jgi:hypothetical protein
MTLKRRNELLSTLLDSIGRTSKGCRNIKTLVLAGWPFKKSYFENIDILTQTNYYILLATSRSI